ncbi:alpha/beta hydrolase [Prescottella agglutinans]|uniref:alpha/beta hydrolase n=1 Tax=Prescottella agglutinans TaxID=1644129 RepID=UPI003D99FA23
MTRTDVDIPVQGSTVSAWHYPGEGDAFLTAAGRPCVVMAHGFGGTVDSGLEGFAEGLAAAGLDVLAFDYRGFGRSGGQVRQTISIRGQLEDYAAAIAQARRLDGVDPGRIVAWGVSLSGGHVFSLGASDPRLAALIALTPAADALAASTASMRQYSAGHLAKSGFAAVRDKIAAARGGVGVTIPLAARPGEVAALALPGIYEDYLSIAGPSWRNEVSARSFLEIGSYRPATLAKNVTAPLLVQIGDLDRSAPPHAAAKAAEQARAEVRRYPCDHFDVYPGKPWFDRALEHQIMFLRRHLAVDAASSIEEDADARVAAG